MEVQQDFRELLKLLNEHDVAYIIVGGYALAFYGAPRYTGDIDLFVNPSQENAKRILDALDQFGFGGFGLTIEDFVTPENVVQLGYPPVRIDFITSISGISWEEAFINSEKGSLGDIPTLFIGKEQFIKNKKASGRIKDIADLEALNNLNDL
jgi:predicted nucleotidyltransferase